MRRPLLMFLMAVTACSSSTGPRSDGGPEDAISGDAIPPVEAALPDAPADAPGADGVAPDAGGEGAAPDAPADGLAAALDATADGASAMAVRLTCAACPAGLGGCLTCAPPSPATGCKAGSCSPCQFPHAATAPSCAADSCSMGPCDTGWGDCDGDPGNGCETKLDSLTACRQCGTVCAAGKICAPDGCRDACLPPATACGSACVDLASDPENCGGCSTKCVYPTMECRAGKCQTPACKGTMCGGSCVDLNSDVGNCGTCGHSCPSSRRTSAACVAGTCQMYCRPGYTVCGTDCFSLANDRANCGVCGRACAEGEVCAEGRCAAVATLHLAEGLTDPLDLAVDAENVYWTDATDGTISRISRKGGPVVRLADKQAKPARIALADTHVYWSNALGAAIMRVPKAGGTAEVITVAVAPTELTVVGNSVYYLNNMGNTHELRKVPVGGGTGSVVVSCTTEQGVDASDPTAADVTGMVRDGNFLYVVCPHPYRQFAVLRVDTANADAMKGIEGHSLHQGPHLAVNGKYFFHLAGGTATSLYWYDKNDGTFAGSLRINGVDPEPAPGQMVASGCGLFWWGFNKFVILSPDPFPNTSVIDRGAMVPRRTVVDGDTIFWTERNAVGKMAIP